MKNATYTANAAGGGAVINGTIDLLGGGTLVQSISGEVVVSVTYVHINGQWVISREARNFVSLSLQLPLA